MNVIKDRILNNTWNKESTENMLVSFLKYKEVCVLNTTSNSYNYGAKEQLQVLDSDYKFGVNTEHSSLLFFWF